jgi:hypothetical protein
VALEIASTFNWNYQPFRVYYSLSTMFGAGKEYDKADTHIQEAKRNALDDRYYLGRATETQADI